MKIVLRESCLNNEIAQKIWSQNLNNQYDWILRLWSILMFQSWLEENK